MTDLAERIASISNAMGLDDKDEALLWRYLHELPPGVKPSANVLHVLSNLAETQPVIATAYKWRAEMPSRFYTDKQKMLSRFGFDLRANGEHKILGGVLVEDIDRFIAGLVDLHQAQCFKSWFNRVTACLREDGVNWEPPLSTDIIVEITVVSTSIEKKLRQFM